MLRQGISPKMCEVEEIGVTESAQIIFRVPKMWAKILFPRVG